MISSVTGEGVEEIRAYAAGSRTIAFLGSSGVGKSTLLNRLVGEELQAVKEIAADGRGRHTTTRRGLRGTDGGCDDECAPLAAARSPRGHRSEGRIDVPWPVVAQPRRR